MLDRGLISGLAALLVAGTSMASAQQPSSVSTAREAEQFLQTYYENPRPAMIEDLIEALRVNRIFERSEARPPYIGYFSEVFSANPDRLARWREVIARQSEPTKGVLESAQSVKDKGGVLTIDGHSAAIGDMYWGAFFATGEARFISKLIEQLRYYDERAEFELFMAGAAAKWSLSSNARSHARVRAILEESMNAVDPRTGALIVDLLNQDPGRIRQEIGQIARERWGRYWVSPDRKEVVVIVGGQRPETFYFNNDSGRLCHRYKISGVWSPTGQKGLLQSMDGRQRAGVALYSPKDLSGENGPAAITRASNLLAAGYEATFGRIEAKRLAAFQSSRPGSMKWTSISHVDVGGRRERVEAEKVLVEIVPGWVAQISASGTSNDVQLFRDIIDTLSATSAIECYWPLIRRQFPYVRGR